MLLSSKTAPVEVVAVTVAVITAETHNPLPHCAYIHCLVSINIQKFAMNINE